MPDRDKLLAATKSLKEMTDFLEVDSLGFLSVDGLYEALECAPPRPGQPAVHRPLFHRRLSHAPLDRELPRAATTRSSASSRFWSAPEERVPRQSAGSRPSRASTITTTTTR